MALSLVIAFISCFTIVGAETSNLLIVKFTPKFKIHLVIVVVSTDFFNILIACRCFFFSIVFFSLSISIFGIAISQEKLKIKTRASIGAGIEVSLIDFQSLNLIFFLYYIVIFLFDVTAQYLLNRLFKEFLSRFRLITLHNQNSGFYRLI